MHKIDPIRSLMDFNRRVLDRGTPRDINSIDDVNTLSELLFFNTVFTSNTEEMFEKHNMIPAIDEYIDLCQQRTQNIRAILKRFCMIQRDVAITDTDCFEEHLLVERFMDQIYAEGEPLPTNHRDHIFIHGMLYNVTMVSDDYLDISCVDPKSSLFDEPLYRESNGRRVYWKTDTALRDRIRAPGDTDVVTLKVTRNQKTRGTVKVEFSGDPELMKCLLKCFPANILVISNPFLYTDDIVSIVKSKTTKKKVQVPDFNRISFQRIFQRDVLSEYPLNSFDDYVHLLQTAAQSDLVSDIYITLYRIGSDPAIFYALRTAVRNSINVHVNIELFASGEDINKFWLREMQAAGIKVTTYRAGEVKVHCKLTLIQFHSGQMIAQIGTGNYHTITTRQYTDLSFLTSNPEICQDVWKVFQVFEGHERQMFGNDVLVTQFNARRRLVKLIDDERRKGAEGYIVFKCNALDDPEIIKHLDEAAEAGCRMDLIVRGVCTWLPGNINNTVTIRSIVWDKLEHSRVYAFGAKNPKIFIGSLDLVKSKLDKRIETLVRLRHPDIILQVVDYLNRYITNTADSWIMTESGDYRQERLI